ncbi:helix-turn-helix domain-containing protein [Photorhabdus temperata]|nr:helix-turn-helix domain-containing protein [Photorhabdus temperata]
MLKKVLKMSGYRIKELRQSRAWSQEQLAELSSLSVRTIQRLENGEKASLETLAAIASAFNIKVTDLYSPETDKITQEQAKSIDKKRDEIQQQVALEAKFYRHLVRFIITSIILLLINWVINYTISWSGIVIFILGVLLINRWLKTFFIHKYINRWKNKRTNKLINK